MVLAQEEFLAVFVAAVFMYFYENVDPTQKPKDTHPKELLPIYDFIIVGGGSAGCVLANRLSENSSWKVLLIEDGGDENAISNAPNLASLLLQTEMSWNYTTVKQRKTCLINDGICKFETGRVLGGSSAINFMHYVRGNKADFDEWASLGNKGWSYKDVLPYFIKAENATSKQLANSFFHGTDGPLNVQFTKYKNPLQELYIKAGNEFGLKETDYNNGRQTGIAHTQYTFNGPSRESTSKAYLYPIRNRKNLHISKFSEVMKIEIDVSKEQANGVWFKKNDRNYFVKTRKEVIISAGAINSLKLLMLSGIGPKKHLESIGIESLVDLPVGQNFHDHLAFPLYFSLNRSITTINYNLFYQNKTVIQYAKYRDGPLTTVGFDNVAFFNVLSKKSPPNILLVFGEKTLFFSMHNDKNLIQTICALIKPKSRGTIRLNFKSSKFSPLIDPNYLAEDMDLDISRKGLNSLINFMKTPTMQSIGAKIFTELQPKCASYVNKIKQFIECIIHLYGEEFYHPVSTAKMGPKSDKNSVVNPLLLVHGFHNLRVIDASIFPSITRGNLNAPVIMIAEKGSDIIKEKYTNAH